MKRINLITVLSTLLTLPLSGHAETTSRAFPMTQQIMITVYKSRSTGSDQDARTLFDSMNVPIRDSFLGPGKAIESSDRGMSWVCADKGANGVQCTIMMQAKPSTRVSYRPIRVYHSLRGQEAQALLKLLNPNTPQGHFEFQNEEATLRVLADETKFELHYEE
jgi:hypothetical protein